jgi:Homeodomain-like domain
MTARDAYTRCARAGMTIAETARELGVSRAAVTKARARYELTFAKVPLEFKRHCKRPVSVPYGDHEYARVDVRDWF